MAKRKTHEEFLQELENKDINVTPLQKYDGMHQKIRFKCNICDYIWDVTPSNLFRNKQCQRCSGRERYTKNSFIQKLNDINNTIIPTGEYINTATKIKCKCKICNTEWDVLPSKLLTGRGCPTCARKTSGNKGNYKYSLSYILDILNEKNLLMLDEYKGVGCQHSFQCLKCGYIFKTKLSHIVMDGSKCKKCTHESYKMSHIDFIKRVNEVLPEIEILDKYNGSSKRINYKCKICNSTHSAIANNLLEGFGCPYCNASKGEKACKLYFDNNQICYIPQYEFDGLVGVNGGNLKFDFAIFDDKRNLSFLLEYDGIFHYEKQYEHDGFENIQIHDKRKNDFCVNNNIQLIRIPYWEFDNIDKILEDSIQNIMKE